MLGENNTKYPSTLDIKSYNNNYAFGAPHPFRNFNLLDQRHAFNGQEKPNEIKGVGLHYTFKFREYDPIYGRFWSVDPIRYSYPWNSDYAFAENSPLGGIDLEGLELLEVNSSIYQLRYAGVNAIAVNGTYYVQTIYENIPSSLLNRNGQIKYNLGPPVGINGEDYEGAYIDDRPGLPGFWGQSGESTQGTRSI